MLWVLDTKSKKKEEGREGFSFFSSKENPFKERGLGDIMRGVVCLDDAS
jgi:hypothetical protein